MITKINPYKQTNPYHSNFSSKQNLNTPFGESGVDKFVSKVVNESKPISDAISKIMSLISSENFKEIKEPFFITDSRIVLKNMFLRAKKINDSKINLEVTYSNPIGNSNLSINGSVPITSGTTDEVKNALKRKNFMSEFIEKLQNTSNRMHDEPSIID